MTTGIRKVQLSDAKAIAEIYNYYIINTTVTYETQPVTTEEMAQRIEDISGNYPYFVYEQDNQVVAYCYAHPWRTRDAFLHTLETSVYLHHNVLHRGLGALMVHHLIKLCKERGYHALIACISDENIESNRFHESLGFTHVAHYKEVGWKFERWIGLNDYELIL